MQRSKQKRKPFHTPWSFFIGAINYSVPSNETTYAYICFTYNDQPVIYPLRSKSMMTVATYWPGYSTVAASEFTTHERSANTIKGC
jgi:hypothetical protein